MNIKRAKTKQTGSVILEALIAILIFSIGILSLVGMQATAINTVSDSKYRSTAGFLANQMVGTIWATRKGTIAANASNVFAATVDPGFACSPCSSNTSIGNAYTQAWFASGVAADLPQGTASIAIAPTALGTTVTVTVGWQPPDAASGVAPHHHTVQTFID